MDMKRNLLLLLALPCLLSAQVATEGKRTPGQWLSKLQTADGIALRAESIDNLPDSTYTYYDGRLYKAVGITYNETNGWVAQEKGFTDYNYNGVVDNAFKIDYTYAKPGQTDAGEIVLVQEAIMYMMPRQDGVWEDYSREITSYNATNMPVKTSFYYTDGKGGWDISEAIETVEYDGNGNPAVMISSYSLGAGGMRADMRFEIFYDGQGRFKGFNTFVPIRGGTDEGWEPAESIVVTYDNLGNRVDTHFERDDEGEWQNTYIIETIYDERGNVISEEERDLGEDGEYHTVWIDTYRHVYLPDVITSAVKAEAVRSSVVYPNPSTDYVTVSLPDAGQALVTISDLSGKTVGRQAIGRQASIAVHSLPAGVYLLTVQTAGKTDVHKLIVK